MKKNLLLLIITLLSTQAALAVGEHCLIKPKEIATVAQRIFKANKEEGEYFPEQSIIQNRAESKVNFKNGSFKAERDITFEGYYRPTESTWFSILPIPLFVAQLDRDRNIVYICAHNEGDPEKDYVIIYFLKGYKLSKTKFGTFIGDLLFSSLEIDAINLLPVGTIPFKRFFDDAGEVVPFGSIVSTPIAVVEYLQNFVANILNYFVGLGVERIIVRDDHVLLESKIDLNNPQEARFSRKIPLSPEK